MTSVAHIIRRRRNRRAAVALARSRRRSWGLAGFVVLALVLILPMGAGGVATMLMYAEHAQGLPAPREAFLSESPSDITRLYDRDGSELIYAIVDPLGADRRWSALAQLPQYLIDATLITEDPDFLDATSPDMLSVAGDLWSGVFGGVVVQDATLTGRLVRNVALTGDANDRVRESALVAEAHRRHDPHEILEWHLNTNDYGNDAYGVDAAAQIYFGKWAAELTLDEAALLAAIPMATHYNPFANETAARGRQGDVLRQMLAASVIDEAAFEAAINRVTPIREDRLIAEAIAPEYAQYARAQAVEILNGMGLDGARLVARGGLRITTALDLDLYQQATCVLETRLGQLAGGVGRGNCEALAFLPPLLTTQGDQPPNSGQVVILDVKSGELRALVGNAGDTSYQPGVTLQPFVYVSAFRSALYNPATMVLDIPRSFPAAQDGLIYTPSNVDSRFRGPMNLRTALGAALIPPAADVAYRQGIDNIVRLAHQLGLNSLDLGVHDLTLLERDGAVSVLDIAYAYSVFASLGNAYGVSVEPVANGYRARDPVAVLRIEDADGALLWQYNPAANVTNLLQSGLAYLVNDILSDAQTRWDLLGQNNVLDLARAVAVMNGITSDRRDNWTVGYTPQLLTAVHLGRETGMSSEPFTLDTYGVNGAAAVWRALMDYAHMRDGLPPDDWRQPDAIVKLPVCDRSGMLPNDHCPVREELFLDGTQSRLQPDTLWQAFQINNQTGQLATANTPTEYRSQRVFFVPPPEAFDWWQANGLPLPPTDYDTMSRPQIFGSASILSPEPFAYVGGSLDVRGSINADDMAFYQLAYGQGLNPTTWIDIGGQQTEYTRGASLGTWDTRGLEGLYNLRLNVVMHDNTVETQIVQVTVDNTAPTITLSAEGGTIFRYPGDPIRLVADVEDNLTISRVEFYANGAFLGADSDYPYGFEWQPNGVGTAIFSATVFDGAGNSADATVEVEVVRAG